MIDVEPDPAGAIDISVVIPAFNEEQRLQPTVAALVRHLAAAAARWEILVVDDGSTDGTVALCACLSAAWPGVRVIATAPNRGKGHAVRVGMLAAGGAIILMCDADGSTPPSEIPRLLEPIRAGAAAIAIGSRYVAGASSASQPLWRRVWSRVANRFVQTTLVPGVRDTQCGFKAFTRAAARDLFARATVDGWAFDLEVLALARRRGHTVVEIGVAWIDDRRSRVRPWHDFWRALREVATIRHDIDRAGRDDASARRAASPTR